MAESESTQRPLQESDLVVLVFEEMNNVSLIPISKCNFRGLSLDLLNSTWNYQSGRETYTFEIGESGHDGVLPLGGVYKLGILEHMNNLALRVHEVAYSKGFDFDGRE